MDLELAIAEPGTDACCGCHQPFKGGEEYVAGFQLSCGCYGNVCGNCYRKVGELLKVKKDFESSIVDDTMSVECDCCENAIEKGEPYASIPDKDDGADWVPVILCADCVKSAARALRAAKP